ncbi:MAG TPA: PIN domain-containing protein [Caulobacteraceae bacterium]|nr:PIN domain-containing protein [Caulobacteraceae bacterium]
MIAADTSSLVAYLSGSGGSDAELIEGAIEAEQLILPPPVLCELMSKPDRAGFERALMRLPLLELMDGFWRRAGDAWRVLLEKGLKAAMADAPIAQCCIDADVVLIARDRDYRHFARWCGLKLAK